MTAKCETGTTILVLIICALPTKILTKFCKTFQTMRELPIALNIFDKDICCSDSKYLIQYQWCTSL